MRIIVDERERASKVPSYLKTLGLTVEYRLLAMGDYIIASRYVVERKEAHDFISALFSGRLFDQATRLREAYNNAIIIVEGDFQQIFEDLSNPRATWGALSSLAFEYGLTVFFTLNAKQTADFLHTLTKRRDASQRERIPVYRGFRAKTSEEAKLALLSNLPGVGPKLAHRLLEYYGNLRTIFSASVAELTLVEGIGRIKAGNIVDLFESTSEHEKRGEQATLCR